MKTFLLAACVFASGVGAAEQTPSDLAQIQHEYDRRRADALRPVSAWYRAQLDSLQRTSVDQPPAIQAAIAKALAAANEAIWQDDQPEIRQALLAAQWLWRSEDDAEGVSTTFRDDGSVEHVGMRGTWRITGPSEVTIQTSDREKFVLRFNASLSAYEADRRKVSGHRLPARDEEEGDEIKLQL